MSNRAARFWDILLAAYGNAPYHPGKWRVIERLKDKAASEWTGPRVVQRRGGMYLLDLNDYLPRWVFMNAFEVWETRLVQRLVRPGWTVVDVGANIGYYTVLLGRLVSPGGRVYAFEPTQRCYENLVRNIAINELESVCTFRSALGDTQRDVFLTCADSHHPSKTSITLSRDMLDDDVVPMTTLDQFVGEHHLQRLDFLKVDIEGSEGLFLAGAKETLRRFRPVVMIELNPSALAQFGATAPLLVDELHGYGYRLSRITWHGLVPVQEIPRAGEYWNVFAFPGNEYPDASH